MDKYLLLSIFLVLQSQLSAHFNDTLHRSIIVQSENFTNEDNYTAAIQLLQDYATTLTDTQQLKIAAVQHKLSVNYYYADQLDQAITCVSAAIRLRSLNLGEQHPDTQNSLFLRLVIYLYQEKFQEALEDLEHNIAYTKASTSFTEAQRDSILMNRYDELGKIYLKLEDHPNAIFYWQKVRAYRIEKWDSQHLAIYQIEDQLATAYKDMGKYELALPFFEKAIRYYEQHQPILHKELCVVYNNIALNHELLGNTAIAEQYYQKAVKSCGKSEDKINLLEAYTNQIHNFTQSKKYRFAYQAFERGLQLSQSITSQTFKADLYKYLGKLEAAQGNFNEALSHFNEAIQILVPTFSDPSVHANPTPQAYNVQSKYNLLTIVAAKANLYQQFGAAEDNISALENALSCYEDVNQWITTIRMDYRTGQSKFLLLQRNTQWYEQAISTALLLHQQTKENQYLEKAYQFNANNKSIVLLDALRDESAKSFAGLPATTLAEEKQWKKAIHECETLLYELPTAEKAAHKTYTDSLFRLKEGYKQFQQTLEQQYPNYYSLKYAFNQPPSIQALQTKLGAKTLLLEYFVGEEQTYIFAITPNDFQVHTVKDSPQLIADIEALNRFLVTPSTHQEAKNRYLQLAHQLYQRLVAVALHSQSSQELLLIPDGVLAQLSFESLLDQSANALTNATPFLIKKYAISYLYSSNFLFLNPVEAHAEELFGGFGIEYDDHTLQSLNNKSTRTLIATRSIGKLTYSDDEVLAISKLLDGVVWLNEEATKSAFLQNANRFRVLHLAMHAALNEEQPLQSALIFNKSETDQDYFLRAGQLYNLQLNADLVVLSACNTGTGQINKGEGVRSLARAFQYAGTRSLVASLWAAPDQTTKEIAVHFYRYLQQGWSKNTALQQAQLDYLNDPNTSPEFVHPNYWAHLIVIGDTSSLELQHQSSAMWWIVGLLLLVLVVMLILRKPKPSKVID